MSVCEYVVSSCLCVQGRVNMLCECVCVCVHARVCRVCVKVGVSV